MGTVADKASKVPDTKRKIAAAIEQMTGRPAGDVFADYPEQILGIQTGGGSGWTGHADVEGLKAIGWTDDDIAYYQQHGVNWNEEDDTFHKVPEDNKELYGVINIDNIQQYKDILVYLPKIDTTGVTNMSRKFQNCYSLVSVPLFDTSSVVNISYMFQNCYTLVSVPLFDTSSVTSMSYMFSSCYSLVSVPLFDTSSVTSMSSMFSRCYSLVSVPLFDTSSVTSMSSMFYYCYSLVSVPLFDTSSVVNISYMFSSCYSLAYINLNNLKISVAVSDTSLLEKSSLLYMIENAAPTSAITITLSAYCYNKYNNDPDVLAALSAQPLVSLASA